MNYIKNLNQEQKYTYNKIDLKFVSINQDPYKCKVFISIAYLPLNVNKQLQTIFGNLVIVLSKLLPAYCWTK